MKKKFPQAVHSKACNPAYQNQVYWAPMGDGTFAVFVADGEGLLKVIGTGTASTLRALDRNFQLWGFTRLAKGLWFHPGVQPGSGVDQLRSLVRVKGPAAKRQSKVAAPAGGACDVVDFMDDATTEWLMELVDGDTGAAW